jgi:uncharacterized membrane protein
MDTYGRRSVAGRNGARNEELDRLASALGWFSVGLGAAELFTPGIVSRAIGVRNRIGARALLRTYGARELAAGLGILTQRQPAAWLWARVAGDMLDIATLGLALSSERTSKPRLIAATAAVAGVTALDLYCGREMAREPGWGGTTREGRVHVSRTITINRPPGEVYRYWRNFENAPSFMQRVESVVTLSPERSHWKIRMPGGKTIGWDAEIVEDPPDSLIAWRSAPEAWIRHSGFVRFEPAPGGRGTIVRADMEYSIPGAGVTAIIAKLFDAEPGQHLDRALRSLKQILETGEVLHSDSSIYRGMHAAQPAADQDRVQRAREWSERAPSLSAT